MNMMTFLAQLGPTVTTQSTSTTTTNVVQNVVATTQDAVAATQPAPSVLSQLAMPIIMGVLLLGMMWMMFRGRMKEEKQKAKLMETLKKGDEVMTIGGLVGKIADISGDRVVLKVDEANNVKVTYLKSAIQKIISDTEKK